MNIIDVIVILMILCAGVVGFKRGFFKELVMTVGLLIVYILAFKFKDPLANWMSLNLPFFNFGGVLEGATSLNIIVYQFIAFALVFSVLMIIFKVVLAITNVFEKILKYTIILGIPSKILGFIIGAIEGYIVMFIFVFIMSQPFIPVDLVYNSKLAKPILNSSPVLSNVVSDTNKAIGDIYTLEKNFAGSKDVNYFNNEVINILLKYDIVTNEYISKLKAAGKI